MASPAADPPAIHGCARRRTRAHDRRRRATTVPLRLRQRAGNETSAQPTWPRRPSRQEGAQVPRRGATPDAYLSAVTAARTTLVQAILGFAVFIGAGVG